MSSATTSGRNPRFHGMRTRKLLRPGEPGTKKVVQVYGESLVCVRYRYDPKLKRKIKTVELVIEDLPWEPAMARIPANKIMSIRVDLTEVSLRRRVKSAGGKWNGTEKVWKLSYQQVKQLGLTNRIVNGQVSRGVSE